ncbi:hypothetical protein M3172_20635 [Mesobacillus subterraneus]|uniref:hypothetical protein n=1 Tax=Mesobacillus subterraneus TaxID=285983 RepID=UPI00203E7C8A|nr:hypothetical protein [Mesobacillus subterraneus]MCM3575603.1 hypothetical protein [Mesobacillus subterraneus]
MIKKEILLSKAIHFLSPSSGIKHDNLNVHMFTEDMLSHILPIGGKSSKHPDFKIDLEGNQEDIDRFIMLSNIETRYSMNRVTEGVCNFVESIASMLSYQGRAYYRIEGEDKKYKIRPYTSERLLRIYPTHYYLRLNAINSPRDNWINLIHQTTIWKIEIPSILGGPSNFKKTLLRLQRYDLISNQVWLEQLSSNKNRLNFNLSEYSKNHDIYLQRNTRKWGWDKRDTSANNKTEFFLVYQQVEMALAKAFLREHILKEINQLFIRLNWDCKVIISGIPSSSELIELKEELRKGSLSFEDVIDKTSLL